MTFAEQVDRLTCKNARRTSAVTAMLEAVALALGGGARGRLSEWLAVQVSRMTLIRLVRALPDLAVSASPRVHECGRVRAAQGPQLRNAASRLEARRPVDILEDRSSDSVAAWLAAGRARR